MATQTNKDTNLGSKNKLSESNQGSTSRTATQSKVVEGSATPSSTMDGVGGTGPETHPSNFPNSGSSSQKQ